MIARYGYDVLGRRIAKRVYSSLTGGDPGYTRFVYHGNQVAYETDSTGAAGLRYTWGSGVDDLVGVRDTAGNRYTTVQDPLHSVRGLVATGGSWQMSQRFTPYGVRLARDSAGAIPKLRLQWTGREFDLETGFYFHRSRFYDPAAKRFVQEDKKGYAGGPNLFAYVAGRPLQARDPFGYNSCYLAIVLVRESFEWHPEAGARGQWWCIYDYEYQPVCEFEFTGPGGGGGSGTGNTTNDDELPPPPASDTCHAGRERQLVLGGQGLVGGGFIGLFLGGGANVVVTDEGRIIFQGQAGSSVGTGLFAGLSGNIGINRPAVPSAGGLSVTHDLQVNANAGLGYSFGLSGTYSQDTSFGLSGTPLVRPGIGYGLQVSAGVVRTVSYTTGPILGPILRFFGIQPACR